MESVDCEVVNGNTFNVHVRRLVHDAACQRRSPKCGGKGHRLVFKPDLFVSWLGTCSPPICSETLRLLSIERALCLFVCLFAIAFIDHIACAHGRERERLKPVNWFLKISWRLKPDVSHIGMLTLSSLLGNYLALKDP